MTTSTQPPPCDTIDGDNQQLNGAGTGNQHGQSSPGVPLNTAALPGPSKTKVERVHSYLAVISTSIGIIGAAGTIFVWLTANVFVGDVEIKPSRAIDSVIVKVIDGKGQQATYYSKHVQLMPGSYHLEVGIPDKKPVFHTDVNVQLWKGTAVSYPVPDSVTPGVDRTPAADAENAGSGETLTANESTPTVQDDTNADGKAGRKHWWQFWRKKDSSP